MLNLLESFPEQCRHASEIAGAFSLPKDFRTSYTSVVVTGLGGSAIGADLVRSYTAYEAKIPLVVNRNYSLAGYVDRDTLVIASSYSGNTEETLSSYKDAQARNATIIAITSGGEVEAMARRDGFPCLVIPKGYPPRCALGYSFFPLLIILSKLGIIKDKTDEIEETIRLLEEMKARNVGPGVAEEKNIAKRLAKALYQKLPVLYGGQDYIDSVVTRWRGQLNENAKTLASSHILPEMNHNEIVGWENPRKLFKDLVVVILRDAMDHPRTAKRMDITKTIIRKEKVPVIEVRSMGKGTLARIFSLVYIGDFTSFYLAILNKRDPTPVERVTYLKNELAKV